MVRTETIIAVRNVSKSSEFKKAAELQQCP